MARRPAARRSPSRAARRAPGRLRLVRVVVPVVFVAVAAFLYVRPLSNYAQTRADLAARERSVTQLRRQKADLSRQLARTTDLEALARQARRIGYVRPGEQLFIVKGVAGWRSAASR